MAMIGYCCKLFFMSFETADSFDTIERPKFVTRVVLHRIEERNATECGKCEREIKFNAQNRPSQVIANLYDDDGVWRDTLTYHLECYDKIGQPHGPPQDIPIAARKGRRPRLKGIFEIQELAE